MLDVMTRSETEVADRHATSAMRSERTHAPMLVVLHQAHSNPGHVGNWLRSQGIALDIRRPALGCPLPETLADHSGAIIFGGPMSANDDADYLRREQRLIALALTEERPFLGICLGGQLLARELGARVSAAPDGQVEIGYYPIQATAEGRAICHWPGCMYQWHTEGFDLPAGSTLLARADGPYQNQAFLYGNSAVGIQFHPEISLALVHRWTTRAAHRFAMVGARPREEHFTAHLRHQPAVAQWLHCFMSRWIAADLPAN